MILIDVSNKPDKDWNKRLISSPTGTIYQTKELAFYQQESIGISHHFIRFINNKGNVIGQLLISIHPRFQTTNKLKNIFHKTPFSKKYTYRWVYGPVIFEPQYNEEIKNVLTKYLLQQKCRLLGSEHPRSESIFSRLVSPFTITNWGTFIIDLTLDEQELWNRLDQHSARKNVKRSKERNVCLREINESTIDDYYQLVKYTKAKAGVKLDFKDTKIALEKLSRVGFKIFVAYENDIPIGGTSFSFFNDYINEWGIGRSERDQNAKLYSQDLLKWEIIKWGKKNECKYFDLTGVNPNPITEKEKGIFRYKKKWGGQFVNYGRIKI